MDPSRPSRQRSDRVPEPRGGPAPRTPFPLEPVPEEEDAEAPGPRPGAGRVERYLWLAYQFGDVGADN